jgi:hypothetical protein
MSLSTGGGQYLTATTDAGLLVIHSLPITLSLVPRDVVNNVYNVGGTITVGTFDSLEEARLAAREKYSAMAEDWQGSEVLPFDIDSRFRAEVHTPEIDGHKLMRHGTRWK